MVVNKDTGTVEHFQLKLPPRQTLNVHITVAGRTGQQRDIVHVDQMELAGGNRERTDGINWVDEIDTSEAHHKLKQVFYPFMDIHWVSPEQAIATAREQDKPIFSVVLWGALDDQSC